MSDELSVERLQVKDVRESGRKAFTEGSVFHLEL